MKATQIIAQLIVLILLIAIIVLPNMLVANHVDSSLSRTLTISTALVESRWDEARLGSDELKSIFDKRKTLLFAVLPHNEINKYEEELVALEAAIAQKSPSLCNERLLLIETQLQHFQNHGECSLDNIL